MTLEERENMKHGRSFLLLKDLNLKTKKEEIADTTSKKTIEDTINIVKTNYENNLKNLDLLVNSVGDFKDTLLDHVIDYLDRDIFENLLNILVGKDKLSDFEKHCLSSLIRAGVVFEQNGKIEFYYNHYSKNLYCWKTNSFQPCNPLDLQKFTHGADLQNKLGLKATTKAYVRVQSKNGPFVGVLYVF